MQSHKRRGIIDSLSAGFTIATRRPLLLSLPLLLDLLLWLAPGISIKSAVNSATSWLTSSLITAPVTPEQLAANKLQIDSLAEVMAGINMLGILGWRLPSMIGVSPITERLHSVWNVGSGEGVVFLFAGLAFAAIILSCVYMIPPALIVRPRTISPAAILGEFPFAFARLASYLLILILSVGILVVGLLLVTLALSSLGPAALGLVSILALCAVLLLSVYLFLVEEAIFVGQCGPFAAISQSIRIANRNFWSVLGLFLLINIITQGMGIVWRLLAGSTPGLAFSVLGHAYIATGLTAAVMVYYWDLLHIAPQEPVHSS